MIYFTAYFYWNIYDNLYSYVMETIISVIIFWVHGEFEFEWIFFIHKCNMVIYLIFNIIYLIYLIHNSKWNENVIGFILYFFPTW